MRPSRRVLGIDRNRVIIVRVDSRRVRRDVKERRRPAALRRSKRGPAAATTGRPTRQFLLLLLLLSVHARLAGTVLVLAAHAKRQLRRLAHDPPRRHALRVARTHRALLAVLP